MTVETNGANGAKANGSFAVLLRAGVALRADARATPRTFNPIDLAIGKEGRIY